MNDGPIVRRISFDIHGEFITQLAREWFYTGEKSHEKVIEILMDSMTGTDTPEAQIRRYAEDILLGRAALKGSTAAGTYHLETYEPGEEEQMPQSMNIWKEVERGWVLLHNPSRGIAFPTKNPVKEYTKAQREFLYDYYMERDCKKGGERNMARRRVRSDEERRIRADERLREELSRGCEYSGTQEIVQETFEEMREQLGMEGDWDEISVTDTDNRGFVLQDVIEEFYDLMIEKVLNYIGAE